jgi:hypothetical protein
MPRFLLLLWLFLAALPAAALEAGDRAAIRQVIEQQVEAFRRDDAVAAYAFAAPNIQTQFPNAALFFRMVRSGYPGVYRARSLSFGDFVDRDDSVAQSVEIIDQSNVPWLAVYTLQKQPDGSWKISGCVIRRAPGQAT